MLTMTFNKIDNENKNFKFMSYNKRYKEKTQNYTKKRDE